MNKPKECIIVDGSCIKGGIIEYRGLHYPSMKEVFRRGPFEGTATNNAAEYLGLISGMIYSSNHEMLPVYSDSKTALAWVRRGKHNVGATRTEQNEGVFKLLDEANNWLTKNKIKVAIEKWQTDLWGENPADFGRK